MSRVEKNESRNLWSQPPEGTQKPSTDVLQILPPLVPCPLSLGSISRGLRALGNSGVRTYIINLLPLSPRSIGVAPE